MDKETYQALKSIARELRFLIGKKYGQRKRLKYDEVWEKATTYRDLALLDGWIDEVANEYD